MLSAIFPGAALVNEIESDASNAFMRRHLLYAGLNQISGS
jgi:hypothetical protein